MDQLRPSAIIAKVNWRSCEAAMTKRGAFDDFVFFVRFRFVRSAWGWNAKRKGDVLLPQRIACTGRRAKKRIVERAAELRQGVRAGSQPRRSAGLTVGVTFRYNI